MVSLKTPRWVNGSGKTSNQQPSLPPTDGDSKSPTRYRGHENSEAQTEWGAKKKEGGVFQFPDLAWLLANIYLELPTFMLFVLCVCIIRCFFQEFTYLLDVNNLPFFLEPCITNGKIRCINEFQYHLPHFLYQTHHQYCTTAFVLMYNQWINE